MRLEIHDGIIKVALSERNLKSLLAKLQGHPPNSDCTLIYPCKSGVNLVVSGEPDAIHYANPERDSPTPGLMHHDTEAAIKENS